MELIQGLEGSSSFSPRLGFAGVCFALCRVAGVLFGWLSLSRSAFSPVFPVCRGWVVVLPFLCAALCLRCCCSFALPLHLSGLTGWVLGLLVLCLRSSRAVLFCIL